MKHAMLAAAIVVSLAACSPSPTPSPSPVPSAPIPSGAALSLPTVTFGISGCLGVGLDSRLAGDPNDPRVAWLVDSQAGRRLEIIWPRGFSARFDPDLAVLDETGKVVYRAGDRIQGGCVVQDPDGPLLILPPS